MKPFPGAGKFYLGSLIAVLLAIAFHITGISFASHYSHQRHVIMKLPESERAAAREKFHWQIKASDGLMLAGAVTASTSVVLLIVSKRKCEQGRHSFVVAFLCVYVLLEFVMV